MKVADMEHLTPADYSSLSDQIPDLTRWVSCTRSQIPLSKCQASHQNPMSRSSLRFEKQRFSHLINDVRAAKRSLHDVLEALLPTNDAAKVLDAIHLPELIEPLCQELGVVQVITEGAHLEGSCLVFRSRSLACLLTESSLLLPAMPS